MTYWAKRRLRDAERESEIEQARAELVASKALAREVQSRTPMINNLVSYLAEQRENNHFGDALDEAFRRRGKNA